MAIKRETFGVTGLNELDKALDSLTEDKFRKAALRNAGKKSMQVVLRDAKDNAPVLKDDRGGDVIAGQLRDDIKMTTSVNISPLTKSGKLSKNKTSELKVLVKTGKDTEDYALVTEFGRESYEVIRDKAFGKNTESYKVTIGKIDPRPFLAPALDNNKNKVLNDFRDELEQAIIIQAKKMEKALRRKK